METLKTLLAIASLLGITFTIEKLPIKISPFTSIKNFFVGDIEKEINTINNKLNDHVEKSVEKEKEDIRYKMLTYHKSLKNGVSLTQYDIMCINSMYDRYHNDLHGNSYISNVYLEIMEMYKQQENEEQKC